MSSKAIPLAVGAFLLPMLLILVIKWQAVVELHRVAPETTAGKVLYFAGRY